MIGSEGVPQSRYTTTDDVSALVKSTPPANGHRRPVVCVNTGQRFSSMTRAGAWAGVSSSTVRWAVVTGGCAGRCPDGAPAKWAADGWSADVKPEVVYTLRFADGAVFVGHSRGRDI